MLAKHVFIYKFTLATSIIFMQKIKTRTMELVLGADGILRRTVFDNIFIELEDAIENRKAIYSLTQGEKCLILTDGRVSAQSSPEVRQYAASKESTDLKIAEALLIDSVASRLLANFFIRTNKPAIPTRIFTDEAKATAWLLSFKDQ